MLDVVIAGAGPNGLMLACELGLAGIRPTVLDPLAGPNPAPRANGIIGQAVRILDHRNLYGMLADTADPPRPAPRHMFAAFALDFTTMPGPQLFFLPVSQPRLVQVLAERAGEYGADVRWGHAVTGFEQRADGVTVRVTGPDGPYELTTKYFVGADGGTSLTRKVAGIDFPGTSSDDVVFRMAFGVLPPEDWVDPESGALDVPGVGRIPAMQFWRAERGVFAFGSRWVTGQPVVLSIELDSCPREGRDGDDEHRDEAPMTLAELSASAGRVLGAELPLRPASSDGPTDMRRFFGVNSRIAARFRSGRVMLVGDAAHVHSPLGGPGLNLGLQDAVNLGWKLAAVVAGRVEPALLDTYEAERRPAVERVIMHSRAQFALIRPGSEVTALRQLFSELLDDPGTVRRLGDLLSGADVRYPCENDAHPLVGHWVPDFSVATPSGTKRVAELARDGRPLLVDLSDNGEVADAAGVLRDHVTVATGRPDRDIGATALLVRPDGYVPWASSATSGLWGEQDLDALRVVLARWFGIGSSAPAEAKSPASH